MDEKIIEISFNIIGYAGEGKGLAFEAIKEANFQQLAEEIVDLHLKLQDK